jgi:hypothetical protein
VTGAFIVTFTGFVPPENDPLPVPVQASNEYPVEGVALTWTDWPALKKAFAGPTVPPVPAFIVRRYCVDIAAVKLLSVSGVTVCERAPPSLHDP